MGFPRQEYWWGLPWRSISFSKGFSRPRDRTWVSCIGRWTLYHWRHQGSPSGTLQAHIQAFWSRGITPPALGFDRIPLWLLHGVFIKCLVKATGIGPCTLTCFPQRCSKLVDFHTDTQQHPPQNRTLPHPPSWVPTPRKHSLGLFHPSITWRWTKKGRNLLFPLCLPTSQ